MPATSPIQAICAKSIEGQALIIRSCPKRMGVKGRLVAHGMRGLARTTLADQGFSHEALEACLYHKVGTTVSQAYNHSTYMAQRVK